MTINKKRQKVDTSHSNFMDGKSWDINDPFTRLQVAATSCFFGEPSYYINSDSPKKSVTFGATRISGGQQHYLYEMLESIVPLEWSGQTTQNMMEAAIDAALDVDIERTLAFAVTLRNEWNIRATAQVIMVRAAMHRNIANTGLLNRYSDRIMSRLDEVMTQMAYFESVQGSLKRIPSRLKRAWKNRLASADDYQLAKYRMSNRNINVFDAVNLTHPRSESIDRLMAGKLRLGQGNTKTWESIRSSGGSWNEAVKVMGHMALLRNLRNLDAAGEINTNVLTKLTSGVEGGRQLPFRYYSAYNSLEGTANGQLLDAVEECLELSLKNAPHFSGRTMSLTDNSGSAHGAVTSSMGTVKVSEIGNLMGVITGKLSDDGHVGVFGDRLETFSVRQKSSIFDQVDKAQKIGDRIGHGTENGIWLFWKQAIENREHWDNVFVYSDMQAGHGGLYGRNPGEYSDYLWSGGPHIDVPKLINTYRQQVNPNVNVFLVQTAGYQDVIVPEYYNRTYILGGWSDQVLNFASKMAQLTQ